jgi:hypothetical protein
MGWKQVVVGLEEMGGGHGHGPWSMVTTMPNAVRCDVMLMLMRGATPRYGGLARSGGRRRTVCQELASEHSMDGQILGCNTLVNVRWTDTQRRILNRMCEGQTHHVVGSDDGHT